MTRQNWFLLFLFLHALGAISALGPTLTYALWIGRAERAGVEPRAFALNTISWIDRHLATPAYVLQAVTGVVLIVLTERRFWQTAWLVSGVALYALMVVFAVGLYAPTFRRQRQLAEDLVQAPGDPDLEARYRRSAEAARRYGQTAVVLTVLIVYLMVVKPVLWSAG